MAAKAEMHKKQCSNSTTAALTYKNLNFPATSMAISSGDKWDCFVQVRNILVKPPQVLKCSSSKLQVLKSEDFFGKNSAFSPQFRCFSTFWITEHAAKENPAWPRAELRLWGWATSESCTIPSAGSVTQKELIPQSSPLWGCCDRFLFLIKAQNTVYSCLARSHSSRVLTFDFPLCSLPARRIFRINLRPLLLTHTPGLQTQNQFLLSPSWGLCKVLGR